MLSSGLHRGRSNEVTVQLLEGPKPRRLIVVGLGNQKVFSVECLREAGRNGEGGSKESAQVRCDLSATHPERNLPAVPGTPR